MTAHDEIASIKAEYDADQELSQENLEYKQPHPMTTLIKNFGVKASYVMFLSRTLAFLGTQRS